MTVSSIQLYMLGFENVKYYECEMYRFYQSLKTNGLSIKFSYGRHNFDFEHM